jgi:hypothetical protein
VRSVFDGWGMEGYGVEGDGDGGTDEGLEGVLREGYLSLISRGSVQRSFAFEGGGYRQLTFHSPLSIYTR